jgi:cytochrome c553
MKRATLVFICLFSLSSDLAAGDAAAGKAKATVCAACHGVDGNSTNPDWPSLAGQHASYIADQVAIFQEGKLRTNPLMAPMIAGLSDQDREDIAAYFASQTRRGLFASGDADLELAEKLYRGGNAEKGTPACMACHGPDGSGNALARFPSIGGQHAKYTATQLLAYRDGTRSSDPQGMMRDIASRLSDVEIEALSEYLAGLH